MLAGRIHRGAALSLPCAGDSLERMGVGSSNLGGPGSDELNVVAGEAASVATDVLEIVIT